MTERPNDKPSRVMEAGRWYWVDKAVIQEYTRTVGALAVAVYHLLASMADKDQSCYPSQKYISDRLGFSRWSVNRAVRKLAENQLVTVEKTPARRNIYHLIPPSMQDNHTSMLDKSNPDVGNGNTNNNQERDINNDTFVCVQENKTTPNDGDPEADARPSLLAKDLSNALNDHSHFSIYLSYAKQYPESFLRRVLAETKMTPEAKIRKSRAALFNYLLHHYAKH